jgi:hypothetical protein
MVRARLHCLPILSSIRLWTTALCVLGGVSLTGGCERSMTALGDAGPPVPSPGILGSMMGTDGCPGGCPGGCPAGGPSLLPQGLLRTSHSPGSPVSGAPAAALSVNLDAVMHLAEAQNAKIALAREQLNESLAAARVACCSCLPDLFRREPFKQSSAEAHVWEKRVNLSKVTNEVLLDTANTYFDWLTARQGQELEPRLESYEREALQRAEAMVKSGEPAQGLLAGAQSALSSRQQEIVKMRRNAQSAEEKLAYLIGQPGTHLLPQEEMTPIDLVDPTQPTAALVQQAVTNGPTVHELEGLENAVACALERARIVEKCCERTGSCTSCGKWAYAQSKLEQVRLALVDARGGLTMGVEQAHTSILAGREEIIAAAQQIKHAADAYDVTKKRVQDPESRTTTQDLLLSIRGLEGARFGYLQAVAAYNKAQARLLLMLGRGAAPSSCH